MYLEKFSQDWIDYYKSDIKTSEFTPNVALGYILICNQFLAWTIIEKIINILEDEEMLSDISHGPLRDFLDRYGEDWLQEISGLSQENERFRRAISYLPRGKFSDEFWFFLKGLELR